MGGGHLGRRGDMGFMIKSGRHMAKRLIRFAEMASENKQRIFWASSLDSRKFQRGPVMNEM